MQTGKEIDCIEFFRNSRSISGKSEWGKAVVVNWEKPSIEFSRATLLATRSLPRTSGFRDIESSAVRN